MTGGHSGPNFPKANTPGQNQPGGGMTRDETIVRLAKIRWWRKRIRHYLERLESMMNYEQSNFPRDQ